MEIGFIGVVVGAVLTFTGVLITSYINRSNLNLQLNYQTKEANRIHRRNKLEELHEKLGKFLQNLKNFRIKTNTEFFSEKIDSRNFSKDTDFLFVSIMEITTLCRFYAPQLEENFKNLVKQSVDFYNATFELFINFGKTKYQNPILSPVFQKFDKEGEKLSGQIGIMLIAIEEIGFDLTGVHNDKEIIELRRLLLKQYLNPLESDNDD